MEEKENKKKKEEPKETTNENTKEVKEDILDNMEDEIKKEGNNIKIKKKSNNKLIKKIILVILLIISCISIPLVLYIIDNGNPFVNKAKLQLQYTETSDNIPDGVYITDVSEVVENVMPAIVAITNKTLISNGWFGPGYGQNQYTEGAGSGIIVGKSDTELLIVTNYHVVEDASELTVQFINDVSVDATVKGVSERKDIAVISIKLSDINTDTLNSIKIATMGNSDDLKVGNGVIAIGNALGYGQSVTTGIVSALDRKVTIDNYTNEMIQIDAAINGGNSGGALLNSKGEVVGINSAKYSSNGSNGEASVEGMGFAIPISDVNELITDLINGEEISEGATLGIEGYMTNEGYGISYNVPTGFYIAGITEGSGAEAAGLEIGNIITEIEGEKVEALSDIQNVLYDKKAGDEVTLKVKYVSGREYKEKEVKVTLS